MARIAVALLTLAFLMAGCTSNDDDDSDGTSTSTSTRTGPVSGTISGTVSISGTGAPGGQTVNKEIKDNEYVNGTFTIKRGDTVKWTNMGNNPHSVTSEAAGFDGPSASCTPATPDACLKNGNSYQHKFDVAGSFPYHCKIHSTMTGTITVEN